MLKKALFPKRLMSLLLLLIVLFPSCSKTYVMPQININGDLTGISHDDEVNITAVYRDSSRTYKMPATLKWQGDSSLAYPKKNYTIKFDDKIKLVNSWGKQKKYCLKANYIDYSQARNVVSAKLYGQIGKTRKKNDEYSKLVNCGAIDGYPIIVNLNDKFEGIYTMNIPKDEWCFNMCDDNLNQAVICASDWTDTTCLRQPINGVFSKKIEIIDSMELKYNSKSKKGDFEWITISFNKMVNFLLNTSSSSEFKTNITSYINIDRSIDTMLYSQFIYAKDNSAKNIIWTTYDGNVWSPNIYDLDGTWGLRYDGQVVYDPNNWLPNESCVDNTLWQKLYEFCFDDIKARYTEIRKKVLNKKTVSENFQKFDKKILKKYKELEDEKWKDVPSKGTNNIDQIVSFTEKRIEAFDNYFQVKI